MAMDKQFPDTMFSAVRRKAKPFDENAIEKMKPPPIEAIILGTTKGEGDAVFCSDLRKYRLAIKIIDDLDQNLFLLDEEGNFVFSTNFEAPYTNPRFTVNRLRHDLLTCAARLGGTASVTNEFLDNVSPGGVPHELHKFTLEIKIPKDTVMKFPETMS